jgi:DNA-binding response OmpR family regulator
MQQQVLDLLLFDSDLPEISGEEICRIAREESRVLLCAYGTLRRVSDQR